MEYTEVLIEVKYEDNNKKMYNEVYDISLYHLKHLGLGYDMSPIEKFFNGNSSNGGKLVENLSKINKSIMELRESIENKTDIDEEQPKGD